MDWGPWKDAVDPVLDQHGFTPLGTAKRTGAEQIAESTDNHGATLRLFHTGSFEMQGATLTPNDCS